MALAFLRMDVAMLSTGNGDMALWREGIGPVALCGEEPWRLLNHRGAALSRWTG